MAHVVSCLFQTQSHVCHNTVVYEPHADREEGDSRGRSASLKRDPLPSLFQRVLYDTEIVHNL